MNKKGFTLMARIPMGLLVVTALVCTEGTSWAIPFQIEAYSSSGAGGSSLARVVNGVVVDNIAGAGGSSNVVAGATSALAETSQFWDPFPFPQQSANSRAFADLATGSLASYAEANVGGGIGIASSRWWETITFNNQSGSTVELPFFWETVGVVTDQNGPALGFVGVTSSIVLNNENNAAFSPVTYLDSNPLTGGLGGAQFLNGMFTPQGTQTFGFQPSGGDPEGAFTTTLYGAGVGAGGGMISATLLVPIGLSGINIQALLNVDCRAGAVCDFGNTSTFRFGALSPGLTWTSDSGVFLSGVRENPGPEVPEPAAIVLLGTGLLAIARRARRRPRT